MIGRVSTLLIIAAACSGDPEPGAGPQVEASEDVGAEIDVDAGGRPDGHGSSAPACRLDFEDLGTLDGNESDRLTRQLGAAAGQAAGCAKQPTGGRAHLMRFAVRRRASLQLQVIESSIEPPVLELRRGDCASTNAAMSCAGWNRQQSTVEPGVAYFLRIEGIDGGPGQVVTFHYDFDPIP